MKLSGKYIISSFLIMVAAISATAQQADIVVRSEFLREAIHISTDRKIYIAGEEVMLKVYKTNASTALPDSMSKVVYVELLDRNNFPVKQVKIRTQGSSGYASFILPASPASGNYILRAYTLWMKNWPASTFAEKEISVINPFENIENLVRSAADNSDRSIVTSPTLTGLQEKPGLLNISVSPDREIYGQREKVQLSLILDDSGKVAADLSVSVVRSVLAQPGNFALKQGSSDILSPSMVFIPEMEGHLISGSIKIKATGEAVANSGVSLSHVGKKSLCQFAKTDSNGHFYFVTNINGTDEIVIQPIDPDISGWYIDLEQPFSSIFSDRKAGSFFPDSSQIEPISKAVISAQVRNIYLPFMTRPSTVDLKKLPDFYGKPDVSVKIDDYIELTTVREAVKEIIPGVLVIRQNGKTAFRIINKLVEAGFENSPLVLVDGIPVYDVEKVLKMNSKDIERADVINTKYHYSGFVFDGIISFVTRKGDLSAMEFDNSIFRQVYEFCARPVKSFSPLYNSDELRKSRIPDFRNTIYWAPDVIAGNGKSSVEFYTSDEPGEYTVIIEGIASDGRIIQSSSRITVK